MGHNGAWLINGLIASWVLAQALTTAAAAAATEAYILQTTSLRRNYVQGRLSAYYIVDCPRISTYTWDKILYISLINNKKRQITDKQMNLRIPGLARAELTENQKAEVSILSSRLLRGYPVSREATQSLNESQNTVSHWSHRRHAVPEVGAQLRRGPLPSTGGGWGGTLTYFPPSPITVLAPAPRRPAPALVQHRRSRGPRKCHKVLTEADSFLKSHCCFFVWLFFREITLDRKNLKREDTKNLVESLVQGIPKESGVTPSLSPCLRHS
ncbi:hypothetical protein J6590_050490 [Homalodisca vitripennis]|nr:hypothetical protein J6590_050490 [Homalodisca vitripennis]